MIGRDGSITFVEIKRNDRDLKDPDYQSKLSIVSNACSEHGIRFIVVYRHQIWKNIVHRRNVALFFSRRFTTIRPEHIDRLDAFIEHAGSTTATFGNLAHALDPTCARTGEAVLQALTVARRIQMDLTQPLLDSTPVTIH